MQETWKRFVYPLIEDKKQPQNILNIDNQQLIR